MPGRVVVGTSSWADPGFVEEWYPRGLPARARLPWYAERFEAVELNSSFYSIPEAGTVARWAAVTPPGFTFDVKLHRLLSRHSAALDSLPPDLRGAATTTSRGRVQLTRALEDAVVDRLLEELDPLVAAGKLSSFLLQLSPAFSPHEHELSELDGLLRRLAPHPVAVELRHRSWVKDPDRAEETLAWYEDHEAAWVCVDAPASENPMIMPPLDAVTSPRLAYLRLHGRNEQGYLHGRSVAERFGWEYSEPELQETAARVHALGQEAQDVRTMFNNNRGADAPSAATRFRAVLGQDPGPPPPAPAPVPPPAAAVAPADQLRLL